MQENAEAEGWDILPIDLGPALTGDRSRMVLDYSNWVVLGQCPAEGEVVPDDTRIRLGVLKYEDGYLPDREDRAWLGDVTCTA